MRMISIICLLACSLAWIRAATVHQEGRIDMRLLLAHGRDQQGQDRVKLKADWLSALGPDATLDAACVVSSRVRRRS
jgi:hypothetical protein